MESNFNSQLVKKLMTYFCAGYFILLRCRLMNSIDFGRMNYSFCVQNVNMVFGKSLFSDSSSGEVYSTCKIVSITLKASKGETK